MNVKVVLVEVSLMNFILRISSYVKWRMKVVLREVSLMNFILRIFNEVKMEVESGVTRSIIDEVHSSDIQRGQTEG